MIAQVSPAEERQIDVAQHGEFVPGASIRFAQIADFEDGRFDSVAAAPDALERDRLIRNK